MPELIGFVNSIWPALLRNVGGWLTNSLQDGKIVKYEWEQLAATTLRVLLLSAGVYWGWSGLTETQIDGLSAGMTAMVLDFFITALKKKK